MFKRLRNILILLFVISLIAFSVTRFIPGDPRIAYLNTFNLPLNEENLNYISTELGLDIPVYKQYWIWLKNMLTLKLGNSYITGVDVYEYLKISFLYSLKLMGATLFLIIVVSFPLGVISALKRRKGVEKIIRIFSLIGVSLPKFCLGFLLIDIFGVKMRVFPISGAYGKLSICLPAFTLALSYIGYYTQFIHDNMVSILKSDFIKYARLRGVSEKRVIFNYAFLNTLPQLVSSFVKTIGKLLGGVAIVENIFAWPGLGRVIVEAIDGRDYPIIQSYIFLISIIFIVITTLGDIICQYLNPRLRWRKNC